MTIKGFVFLGALISFLVIPGCGGGPKIVPVEGTVTLDGKPLDKIMVEFWPEAEGPRSFGETDAQGHFKLTTDGKTFGAVVGDHKVILKDSSVLGDKFMGRKAETMDITEGRKSRIAGNYGSPESTPLSQKVEAGKKNEFALTVTKK